MDVQLSLRAKLVTTIDVVKELKSTIAALNLAAIHHRTAPI
jgi:hypothetical protein